MKLTKVKKVIATITAIAGLGTGILTATAASVGNLGGSAQPFTDGYIAPGEGVNIHSNGRNTIPIDITSKLNPHPIGYLDSWLPNPKTDIINFHGFTTGYDDTNKRKLYYPSHQDGTFTVNHIGSFTGDDGAEHPLSANITVPMTDMGYIAVKDNDTDTPAFQFLTTGKPMISNNGKGMILRVHLYSPDGTRIPQAISTGFLDIDGMESIGLGEGITHVYVTKDNEIKFENDMLMGLTDTKNNNNDGSPDMWNHYAAVDVNPDFEFDYGNFTQAQIYGAYFHPLIAQTSLHVTYDPNGGQGAKQDKLIVRDSNPYTIEKNSFTRANYQFTGWNTKADGTGDAYQPGKQIPIPEKNTTFYAQWKRSPTTISYSANGSTGSVPPHTGYIGSPVTIAGGFTRTGYDMTGYIGSDGKTYQVGQQVNQPDSDVELRAQWAKKHVTLTVEPNGATGEAYTRTYEYGDTASPTNLWQRDGYRFTGFTTTPTGGNNLPDSFPLTQNMTVYANWQAATHWYTLTPAHPTVYRVTLNPNGGLGDPISRDGHHNQTVNIPDGGYTRTGYHTDGYSLTPDCAVKLAQPEVTLTADMTVYQCWAVNTHQLTLNPNGGDGKPQVSTHNEGDTLSVPANPFTRDHYTFTGWTTTPDGGQPVTGLTMNGDMTLYAQWKKNTVTVTLDMNGGNGQPQVNTVDYGDQFTPNTRPTRDGYQFTGWNTTPDGSGVNTITLTATADTVLYAQWKKSVPMTDLTPAHKTSRKLTVDPNGGDGEPLTRTGTHGGTVTIPDTTFTRNGYHKNGYSLTPDCAVKLDTAEVKLTKDMTVYQCWGKDNEPKPEPKPEPEQKPAQKPAGKPAQQPATPTGKPAQKPAQLASTGVDVRSLLVSVVVFLMVGVGFEVARHHVK